MTNAQLLDISIESYIITIYYIYMEYHNLILKI